MRAAIVSAFQAPPPLEAAAAVAGRSLERVEEAWTRQRDRHDAKLVLVP